MAIRRPSRSRLAPDQSQDSRNIADFGNCTSSNSVAESVSDQSLGQRDSAAKSFGTDAVRLEKRTHLNTGNYKIILHDFGDGIAEIGWSFVPVAVSSKVGKGKSTEREENEDRAVRRAKSRLRHLILALGADHLLTLTYRKNVTDFAAASADLAKFVRTMRRNNPKWAYVAVAEQQKRGAWHWHLAVCGRQDVNQLRSAWRRVVGEGNIDVNPPRGNGKQRALALVRYLGKYLGKGFSTDTRSLNARRFRSSHGIVVPEVSLMLPYDMRAVVKEYAQDQLTKAAGTVGHVWDNPDLSAGWACSWE
jgi:hypothetical protein